MRLQHPKLLRNIYLTGFSGSGKSTVGARLAVKLNYRFVDVDSMISKKMRASVTEIFDSYGEQAFRREETDVLRKCALDRKPTVVAVGGGGIERAINRRLMRRSGMVIYLKCSLKDIRKRLQGTEDRPLLRGSRAQLSVMRALLKRRKPIYESADATVVTSDRTISQVVNEIKRLVTVQ